MSVYTTQLRFPVEQMLDDLGLSHAESNWPQVYKGLGLDSYPIFEEAHRQVLNDKIIRRYYFREIGLETVGLFRWYMNMTMQEIMPYYNQLYLSAQIEFDPLATRNMSFEESWGTQRDVSTDRTESRTDTGTTSVDQTTEGNSQTKDKDVFSDTPMSMLQNAAPNPIENAQYATSVDLAESNTDDMATLESKTDTSSKADTSANEKVDDALTGKRTHTEKGYDRSAAEMLLKYRETLINIDAMVLNDLESLFMGIA